ncbi:MAG: hypothetical protein QJR13_03660 [Bacillota bacterium]|nr:hypothetical protein [Bacillota bacterium]
MARKLEEAWFPLPPSSPLLTLSAGTGAVIDLGTVQGRFELLALAILYGARVKEKVAEEAFLALREAHLLSLAELGSPSFDRRQELLAALQAHYRALANKVQKAEALVTSAVRLCSCYGGDAARLHCPGEAWEETVRRLSSFPQIRGRAFWICREMRRAGIWPGLDPAAGMVADRPVREALWRLGFAGREVAAAREVPAAEYQRLLWRYFRDPLPAFYQGSQLCARRSSSVCACACKVSEYCLLYSGQRRKKRLRQESLERRAEKLAGLCGVRCEGSV